MRFVQDGDEEDRGEGKGNEARVKVRRKRKKREEVVSRASRRSGAIGKRKRDSRACGPLG